MKLTSAPLARSSSATAMAGTTCPAVPPAATTTLVSPPTYRSTPSFARGRTPAIDDAQFASAGGRRTARRLRGAAAGHVEDQADSQERRHQAAVAVGDEG